MKKKFLFYFLVALASFLITNVTCYGEDFFIDANFQEAKNKIDIPNNKTNFNDKTKKKKFFSKNKFTRFNFLKNKSEEIPQGYYGTLPDIEEDFKYKKQNMPTVLDKDLIIPKGEIQEENLKQAPIDDALFLDKILKKEPETEYIKDLKKIKTALLNLKNSIEQHSNIQKFNACVNMLELQTKNFKNKYQEKSESLKESYINILNTNYYAKVLGNLKFDANYYSRYIAIQNSKYSNENISFEENKLLNKINKTIFTIDNEF